MFSWVVKVVPQPPEPPGKLGEEGNPSASTATGTGIGKKEEAKQEPNPAKSKEELSEENSFQSGVLSWISHGLNTALPQPVNTSKPLNNEAKQQEENAVSNSKTGMIGWIVQGLGKVVPQPDEKYLGQTEPEETTETAAVPAVKVDPPVYEVKDLKDAEPLPHIPVVEIISDEEPDAVNIPFSPKVMEWIKQGFEKVVPQSPIHLRPPSSSEAPVLRAASAPVTPYKQAPTPAPASTPTRTPSPAPVPTPSPAPAPPPAPATSEPPKAVEESKGVSMVGWIVQGFGRMMPQPVLKPKDESSDVVQNGERVSKAP